MTEVSSSAVENISEFQNGYERANLNRLVERYYNPELRLVDYNYYNRITLIIGPRSRQTESTPNLTIDRVPSQPFIPTTNPIQEITSNNIPPASSIATITSDNNFPGNDDQPEVRPLKKRSKFSLKRLLFCRHDKDVEYNSNPEKNITSNSCVICLGGNKVYACVPCGHKIICEKCRKTTIHLLKRCPMCRTKVERILRIYD